MNVSAANVRTADASHKMILHYAVPMGNAVCSRLAFKITAVHGCRLAYGFVVCSAEVPVLTTQWTQEQCQENGFSNPCPRGEECFNFECTPWFSQPIDSEVGELNILCESGAVDDNDMCITQNATLLGQSCVDDERGYSCVCNSSTSDQGVLVGPNPAASTALAVRAHASLACMGTLTDDCVSNRISRRAP